ncbi:MAG: cardiolipin synthase [Clostridia bacterium]|nr:cardiolipin synthase [Clostridia bacterium]
MRKLWRFLFSRYFISAAVILLELLGMAFLISYAYDYSIYAFAVMVVLDVLLVISLINREANPEYKVSWLVVVLLVPIFGGLLYFIFYSTRVSRSDAKLMRKIQNGLDFDERTEMGDDATDTVFSLLKAEDPSAAGKAFAIMNDDGSAAIFNQSVSEVFDSGEEMYKAMTADLKEAKKYIFLEYFIIAEGVMWGGIHEILREKAAAGIEVRIMYDDFGSMNTLPIKHIRVLEGEGIKCRRFGAITPRVSTTHNNRDHRKIMIIDGEIAYTGGINIADEYINQKKRFGHWKDGGVRIFGDAVYGFLKLFLGLWDFDCKVVGSYGKYLEKQERNAISDGGYYIPFGSGPAPIYPRPVGKNVLLNLINQSEKYIYMTTPYLIIDYDLTESLSNAAMRGVDVRIITPATADKRLIKLMTKSAYPALLKSGVRIYEYTPGFIHEKSVCSDDKYALVGTINLDFRSLAHHYENAVWMYGTPSVLNLKDNFLATAAASEEQSEPGARLTLAERIVRSLMRIFAPLL